MKVIKLPKEVAPFLAVAETVATETLIFTERKKPVAALVSLRHVDRESLVLSTHPEFLSIIERSRKEIRAGKTTSLEAVERKLGRGAPIKAQRRRRKPGR